MAASRPVAGHAWIQRAALFVLVPVVALAGCVGSQNGGDDDGDDVVTDTIPDGVWVFGARTGTRIADIPGGLLPNATSVATGVSGAEPQIGITSSGYVFSSAYERAMRSTDAGKTWEEVHNHPTTLDPMLWVDRTTDRIFFDSLYVACSFRAFSDDDGEAWTDRPASCGIPGIDHQKIATGPWTDAVPAALRRWDNAFYYCYNKIAATNCATSLDGGETFAWDVVVSPADPGGPEESPSQTQGCGGINSNPAADTTGRVYVPFGVGSGVPCVAVSKDSGLTWEVNRFHTTVGQIEFDPDMTTTPDLTAYYMWRGDDSLPYLARSVDEFANADGPWLLAPPEVSSTRFTSMTSGDDGRIAFTFLGTESGYQGRPGAAPDNTTWNVYLGFSLDAGGPDPTFTVVRVTPLDDPIQRGKMWEGGGGDPARNLLDFIDLHIGPEGRPYVAFADGCTSDACRSPDGTPDDSRDDAHSVGLFLTAPSLYAAVGDLAPPPAFVA